MELQPNPRHSHTHLFRSSKWLQPQRFHRGNRADFTGQRRRFLVFSLLIADEVRGLFKEMANGSNETGNCQMNKFFASFLQLPINVLPRVHQLFANLLRAEVDVKEGTKQFCTLSRNNSITLICIWHSTIIYSMARSYPIYLEKNILHPHTHCIQ